MLLFVVTCKLSFAFFSFFFRCALCLALVVVCCLSFDVYLLLVVGCCVLVVGC